MITRIKLWSKDQNPIFFFKITHTNKFIFTYLGNKQVCAISHAKLRESKIFSLLLKAQNLCSSSGLVKISACCLSVLTWLKAISPLVSWSLRKWCLMSMCLVLEWFTWLFASLIALSLSHKSRILLNLQPKSLKVNRIQSSCAQQVPAATYSASAVDRATEFYFLELQDTRDRLRNWQVPEVLFWTTLQSALYESE